MKDEILNIIKKKHRLSGGHCGQSLVTLQREASIGFIELREILNQLWREKEITIAEGVNNKLIFYNPKKSK